MAVISGDGVFSHTCLGASDLATSAKFYDSVLARLGVKNLGPFGENCILYGKDKPALLVLRPGNGEAPSSNGVTVGFAAASTADPHPRPPPRSSPPPRGPPPGARRRPAPKRPSSLSSNTPEVEIAGGSHQPGPPTVTRITLGPPPRRRGTRAGRQASIRDGVLFQRGPRRARAQRRADATPRQLRALPCEPTRDCVVGVGAAAAGASSRATRSEAQGSRAPRAPVLRIGPTVPLTVMDSLSPWRVSDPMLLRDWTGELASGRGATT